MKDNHKDLLNKLTTLYRGTELDNDKRLLLRDAADTIREMRARIDMLEEVIKNGANASS